VGPANHLYGCDTSQTGVVRAAELVPTFTLAWSATHFAAPDLIKIDVKQVEAAVLAGGSMCQSLIPPSSAEWPPQFHRHTGHA
jgi:hypothetical protein